MSYDLEVATRHEPTEAAVKAFLYQDESLRVEGAFGTGSNLVVERRSPGGFRSLFTVDGPDSAEGEDLPAPLASLEPRPRWNLLISVHEAARPEGVRVAQMLARQVAEAWDGVVYDPQSDEIVRTGGERERPERAAGKRLAIVEVEWVFPLSRFTMESLNVLLDVIERVFPQAMPRRERRLQASWREQSVGANRSFASLSWEAREPTYGALVYIDRQRDYPVKGSVAAWALTLSIDYETVKTNSSVRERVVDLFVQIATQLGAFYGAAYVRRGYIERQGKLLTDLETEDYFIPTWNGLPSFPTWLAWFGQPYRGLIAPTLAGNRVHERSGGLFLRMGDEPMTRDEMEDLFPLLPPLLVQNSRIEQHVTHYPGGELGRGTRAIHEVAEFIPSLE